MSRFKATFALGLAIVPAFAATPGNVFKRIYKADEKQIYSVAFTSGRVSLDADIEMAVRKVSTTGKGTFGEFDGLFGAEVRFRLLRKSETGTTRPAAMPEDVIANLLEHNLPEKYSPKANSIDFLFLFLALAGATSDTLAHQDPVTIDWRGGDVGFKGSIRVLSNTEEHTTARLTGNLIVQGQRMGATDLTSVFSREGKILISSEGSVGFAGTSGLRIVRNGK